jgi:hypothetical protein
MNRTLCFGCGAILEYAEDRCKCVDELDAKMDAEAEAWAKAHKDDPPRDPKDISQGFICFEGVLPLRGSLRAISRMGVS